LAIRAVYPFPGPGSTFFHFRLDSGPSGRYDPGMSKKTAWTAALALILFGCKQEAPEPEPVAPEPAPPKPAPVVDDRGPVTVLLLGMPTCPGTQKITEFLRTYEGEKPDDVALKRLDVPFGSDPLEAEDPKAIGFPYAIDKDRAMATKLEFFYYPTLYILDRDGDVRFKGDCDPEEFKNMVNEIRIEKKGDPKKTYTKPLPPVGKSLPAFSGPLLDGKTVSSEEMRGAKGTLLFVGSTSCPFSKQATYELAGIDTEYRKKQISTLIISVRQPVGAIRGFYAKAAPDIPILVDPSGSIGHGTLAAEGVPFFYLVGADGNLLVRQPFTNRAARIALANLLGEPAPDIPEDRGGAG
jgi:peroxiredoxin